MSTELIKIGKRGSSSASGGSAGSEQRLSRRNFLKILGAGSSAAVVGCADPAKQNVLPLVKGDVNQVQGEAIWYRSTCQECSAGCGIEVRTRDGRAVKIEGNDAHPINKGGLCALGQAALQSLYNPDRVREPLERVVDASGAVQFKAISWKKALARVAGALKGEKKKALITREVSGSLAGLLEEFSSKLGVEHVQFEVLAASNAAKASELVFGVAGIPTYRFEKAEVIVNFGADYLETWISPVEYAKGWSQARRAKHPVKVYQIEPRLSLSGANADFWLCPKPGTEVRVALALLRQILDLGAGTGLRPEVLSSLKEITSKVTVAGVVREAGIDASKLLQAAEDLTRAGSSLVLGGGIAASTDDQLSLLTVTNFINLALGNVGDTVDLAQVRNSSSSAAAMASLIAAMNKGEVGLLMVKGANPEYELPNSVGFDYARRKVDLVVSFSSELDETSYHADLILPSHTFLEDWGDVNVVKGIHSLQQPVMSPVFDTRSFGDNILELARLAGGNSAGGSVGSEGSFKDYLQTQWRKLQSEAGIGGSFDSFWMKSVENGGFHKPDRSRVKVNVSAQAFELKFANAQFDSKEVGKEGLILIPYPSVKTFDGRAANRPWLQELPDPLSQAVWDAWVELHPDTAAHLGIKEGDEVIVRNHYGELAGPVYLTPYIHRDAVGIPIGQGHKHYGRYAEGIGGNVFNLLPADVMTASSVSMPLVATKVDVFRGRGKNKLVAAQITDSQMGRGLARTKILSSEDHHDGHGAHALDHGHHGHEPKQMYKQREHPMNKWGMAVDLAACTGCSACVVACYAENNIPVVGKRVFSQGREMSWLRIERYHDGTAEELQVSFLPMMCQHCNNAPCEPVCPVYATYHNEEGLNVMVYNRCVGTRYCSNNCTYKVRRFNWLEFDFPEPLNWQLNPDVTPRVAGVMEKCTFCVQRILEGKDRAKDLGREVRDGEVQPACVQSCPTDALVFGDLNNPDSRVSKLSRADRAYKVLDHHINTQPSVTYLEDVKYKS